MSQQLEFQPGYYSLWVNNEINESEKPTSLRCEKGILDVCKGGFVGYKREIFNIIANRKHKAWMIGSTEGRQYITYNPDSGNLEAKKKDLKNKHQFFRIVPVQQNNTYVLTVSITNVGTDKALKFGGQYLLFQHQKEDLLSDDEVDELAKKSNEEEKSNESGKKENSRVVAKNVIQTIAKFVVKQVSSE